MVVMCVDISGLEMLNMKECIFFMYESLSVLCKNIKNIVRQMTFAM